MEPLTTSDVTNALSLLAETAENHKNNILDHNSNADCPYTEDENDYPYPVFDKFYNDGGSTSVISMINLSPEKFEFIWQRVEEDNMIYLLLR